MLRITCYSCFSKSTAWLSSALVQVFCTNAINWNNVNFKAGTYDVETTPFTVELPVSLESDDSFGSLAPEFSVQEVLKVERCRGQQLRLRCSDVFYVY